MNLLKNIMSTEVQVKQKACHKYLWSGRGAYGPTILVKQLELASTGLLNIWQHEGFQLCHQRLNILVMSHILTYTGGS